MPVGGWLVPPSCPQCRAVRGSLGKRQALWMAPAHPVLCLREALVIPGADGVTDTASPPLLVSSEQGGVSRPPIKGVSGNPVAFSTCSQSSSGLCLTRMLARICPLHSRGAVPAGSSEGHATVNPLTPPGLTAATPRGRNGVWSSQHRATSTHVAGTVGWGSSRHQTERDLAWRTQGQRAHSQLHTANQGRGSPQSHSQHRQPKAEPSLTPPPANSRGGGVQSPSPGRAPRLSPPPAPPQNRIQLCDAPITGGGSGAESLSRRPACPFPSRAGRAWREERRGRSRSSLGCRPRPAVAPRARPCAATVASYASQKH